MKKFGKRDMILIAALLLLCIAVFGIWMLTGSEGGGYVQITVDGKVLGQYPLDKEQDIPIQLDGETVNLLKICDGQADMTWADCPDGLCVRQKAISKTNESIVCLPHKVVVTIEEAKEESFDSIAR